MKVKRRGCVQIILALLACLLSAANIAPAATTANPQSFQQLKPEINPAPRLSPVKRPVLIKTELLPSGYRALKIAQANLSEGRKIYGFQGCSINDQGKVAYVVIYDDTAAGQYSVLLFAGSSSYTIAARSPELPISNITLTHINNQGDVIFRTFSGYTGPTANRTAIWLWRGNQLTMVQSTQNTPYTILGEPALNDLGQIVYKWQTPISSTTTLNTGLAIWANGTNTVHLDESTSPFNRQYFIGDGFWGGQDVYFPVMTKANWTAKALYKRQSAGGQIIQAAAVNQIPLPYQVGRLETDLSGNLYAPTETQQPKANGVMKRSPGGTWQPLLGTGSEWYAVSMPYVARNGVYAFWGMCAGAGCPSVVSLRESICVVRNNVRTEVIKVKQQLTGRTIKYLRLHGVNGQGAMVVEIVFEESGQYTTLFRLDPP